FDENNQDFDILLTALQTADLVAALDDPEADFMVFAPTDAAFVRLAQDLGFTGTDEAEAFDAIVNTLTDLGNGDPVPLLTDILLYHVSLGAQDQTQIKAQRQIDTLLEGASFRAANGLLRDNDGDLIDPRFDRSLADVQAENGFIQGINRVLIPLDIPESDRIVRTGDDNDNVLFSRNLAVEIQAGAGNDSLLGSRSNDKLQGERGKDFLSGNGGNDILRGGRGRDTLFDDQGDNLLQGLRGNDILLSSGGSDILLGGRGQDTIISLSEESFINGGKGNDLIIVNNEATIVLKQGNGTDTIQGFTEEETTFLLGSSLSFGDLSFQEESNFTTIAAGEEMLARVMGVAAETLNSIANFV
ncbi:MAG: fasciclin domain-containing protein, partial [Cyanobacteria bacterium P01_F01_bin.86]